jgi:hypothetical protein
MVSGPSDSAGLKSALHLLSPLYYYTFNSSRLGIDSTYGRFEHNKPEIYNINHKLEIMSRSNILANI